MCYNPHITENISVEDVRLRNVNHRSNEVESMMKDGKTETTTNSNVQEVSWILRGLRF
jgi:hypothetical protein